MKQTSFFLNLFNYKLFIWGTILTIHTVAVWLLLKEELDVWLIVILSIYFTILLLFAIVDIKSQTKTKLVNNIVISSNINGEELCKVDLEQKVYYAIYSAKTRLGETFIVISNQPFRRYTQNKYDDFFYEDYLKDVASPWKDKRNVYCKTTQIKLLYNRRTKEYFPLDDWQEVPSVHPWDNSYPQRNQNSSKK